MHYVILKIPIFKWSYKVAGESYNCQQFILCNKSCDKHNYKQYTIIYIYISVIILLFTEINQLKLIIGD